MSTISLNQEGCQKNGISLAEAILMISLINNLDLKEAETSLISKGLITAKRDDLFQPVGWRVTRKGTDLLNTVLLDCDSPNTNSEDPLTSLATKLKGTFPKGKKAGTNYYWADSVTLIIRRLKLFYKKYPNAIQYSEEDIVKAASNYVKGFNGQYTYMKLLKYFIFKEKVGVSQEVEGESELLNYLENSDQESEKEDWVSTLK